MGKLLAEAIGTFWLVLGGCGSAVFAAAYPDLGIGFAGVSLAFGLTVLSMAVAPRPGFTGSRCPPGAFARQKTPGGSDGMCSFSRFRPGSLTLRRAAARRMRRATAAGC